MVLDKTGTITRGKPGVVEVVPAEGRNCAEVLRLATGAEAGSEHPWAKAILEATEAEGIEWVEGQEFTSHSGQGVEARVDGSKVLVGKPAWLREHGVDLTQLVS
jgi:Cu+-exporting ATPase